MLDTQLFLISESKQEIYEDESLLAFQFDLRHSFVCTAPLKLDSVWALVSSFYTSKLRATRRLRKPSPLELLRRQIAQR